MAKFIIVLCAFIATVSAGPGLVGPLGGFPLAYAQGLPYSSPLTYSASLAYTSPVAYGLASGGSSRVDIQNNYNLAPQFASVPFAARIVAPYTNVAAVAPSVQAPLAPAPLSYNFAQLAAPQTGPVAFSAPVATSPIAAVPFAKFATPVPFTAPQLIPAPLRYSAPLLNNYNYYGSPLSYAFPGQINALPFAAAPTGLPIAGQIAASPIPLAADPSTAQTTRMTAVQAESASENDSEEIPAKLMSAENPSESSEKQKFATPAPVDGPSAAPRDGSQSPVVPVNNN
ncbi:BCL-6 corepressor-like protein 1 [Eupeodes corollae]|uniref:BCL-6 corepressor-like protein 1 n=1 Tax=Eupeodes corollae TaxID=290404 RepID=UPI0024903369|nr:BCL-6 corepressor-like protein 1 [Eupeodes corollae]